MTVSYVLGATQTRFSTFLAASLGLIPGLFVEVYFGSVARHVAKVAGQVSEHSLLHTALTVAGLLACVAVLVHVTRLAWARWPAMKRRSHPDWTVEVVRPFPKRATPAD